MKTPTSIRERRQAQGGFTLLELAIVLVVIGLIIGGVLKGQELIGQAEVRNAQRTLTNLQTAPQVFYGVNGGYPGDSDNDSTYTHSGSQDDSTKGFLEELRDASMLNGISCAVDEAFDNTTLGTNSYDCLMDFPWGGGLYDFQTSDGALAVVSAGSVSVDDYNALESQSDDQDGTSGDLLCLATAETFSSATDSATGNCTQLAWYIRP